MFPESLLGKFSVPTWSTARAFQKAYKTGNEKVSLTSATGKFSTGTSTLTIKFSISVASYGGGGGFYFMSRGGYDDCDY